MVYKIRNVVCYITDNCARKRDHADNDYDQADERDSCILRSDICYDIRHASCIKYHGDRVISSFKETEVLSSRQRHPADYKR